MDRRTEYTINAIKDSLLANLDKKNYNKISITDICRGADIHRSTFYQHYSEKDEVLEAILEEIFSQIRGAPGTPGCSAENESREPLCIFVRKRHRYRNLLLDPDLTDYVAHKHLRSYKAQFMEKLCKIGGYSEEEADALITFQFNGCLSAIIKYLDSPDEVWERHKNNIDSMIAKLFV